MVIAKKVIKALPVIKTPETQAVTFHLNVYINDFCYDCMTCILPKAVL